LMTTGNVPDADVVATRGTKMLTACVAPPPRSMMFVTPVGASHGRPDGGAIDSAGRAERLVVLCPLLHPASNTSRAAKAESERNAWPRWMMSLQGQDGLVRWIGSVPSPRDCAATRSR